MPEGIAGNSDRATVPEGIAGNTDRATVPEGIAGNSDRDAVPEGIAGSPDRATVPEGIAGNTDRAAPPEGAGGNLRTPWLVRWSRSSSGQYPPLLYPCFFITAPGESCPSMEDWDFSRVFCCGKKCAVL